jgi:hypothetical protein
VEPGFDIDGVTEDDLVALALAADPDQPLDPEAIPISSAFETPRGLLPDWYMPTPMSVGRGRTRRWILGALALILVVINGAGLCVTYGFPEIAW